MGLLRPRNVAKGTDASWLRPCYVADTMYGHLQDDMQ